MAGSGARRALPEVGLFPNLRKCSSTNRFVTFVGRGGGEILGLWIFIALSF